LQHHLVDENAAHDLDTLGKYYLPFAPEHKAVMKQRMKEEKGDMSRVDLDTLCEYNSRDAFNTLKLLEIFLPKIDSENMSWAYEVVMMRGINVLSDIGFNGIAIDPEAVKKADKIYEELIADITRKINGRPQVKQAIKIWAEKKMAKAAKPKSVQHYYESFNPASSVQISILLYDVLKMPVLEVI
jgi:DNA polymerase I - 3'-5' exonuclease and polymerase domains